MTRAEEIAELREATRRIGERLERLAAYVAEQNAASEQERAAR